MTCHKSPPPPMKSAVTSSLLLLSLTAPQLVTSFIPSNNHQFNTVKLHQKHVDHEQHSIVNCNNIDEEECHFDQIGIQSNERQQWQEDQQQQRRVGGSITSNIMGLITGQLYATKALAAGLAGVVTASVATGDNILPSNVIGDDVTVRGDNVAISTSTIATVESVESMPKSYINGGANLPNSLIVADNTAVVEEVKKVEKDVVPVESKIEVQKVDATAAAAPPAVKKVDAEKVAPVESKVDVPKDDKAADATTTAAQAVKKVEAAADTERLALEKKLESKIEEQKVEAAVAVKKVEAAAENERLALEKKLAESRSDEAKRIAEKVKGKDVTPPSTPAASTSSSSAALKQDRDKAIAEEEAKIEAAKRAQIEKILKEQEKARLAAEKDAEKARLQLEQRAEKAAQKARAEAEKKARDAKIKAVRDRESQTAEQAKLKYQEAEKAQAARLRAEEAQRKLERDSVDLNTSLEFLRKTEEAKKADAKAADDIRIKAMEERVRLDQELKVFRDKEFQETVEDIALVAVPSTIIAGAVYVSGAFKREGDYQSDFDRNSGDSTPYGFQNNDGGGGPGPFGMGGNQGESPPPPPAAAAPFELGNQGGFSDQNSPPPPGFPSPQMQKGMADVPKGGFGQSVGVPKQSVSASKTKAFGNVYPAPAFPAFQTPLKGRDSTGGATKGFGTSTSPSSKVFGKTSPKGPTLGTSPKQSFSSIPSSFEKTPQKGFVGGQKDSGNMGGPGFKAKGIAPKQTSPPAPKSFGVSPPKAGNSESKSPFGGGGGMLTKAAAPASYGKAPMKGAAPLGGSTFSPGMPSKADPAASPKSFAKASFKKAPVSKNPFGGGMPGVGGPAVGMPPAVEPTVSSKSFGKSSIKGGGKKGPFGGGGMPPKATAFGKKTASGGFEAMKKGPFGKSLSADKKAVAPSFGGGPVPFGKAPIKGGEKKTPFGGGGMPSKAAFGKKETADAPIMKGPFGKSLSSDTMGAKKASSPSFGGGPTPFGKAPTKSPFGGGMPSKTGPVSKSFGASSPKDGNSESKSPFGGGGGMPTKAAAPSSFGKAPMKGAAPLGGSTFSPGMPSKADPAASPKSFAKASFKKAPGSKNPFGGVGGMPGVGGPAVGMPPKVEPPASSKSFGNSSIKGGGKKGPFGGGGMPPKATAFGKKTASGGFEAMKKGPFGKSLSADGAMGGKKAVAPSFGGGPASFGKGAPKSPFGGAGMPSTSFGKAPLKGSPDSKSSFGNGGGMPSKSSPTPTSFGKAPMKMKGEGVGSFGMAPGKASPKGPFGGGGMPSKASSASFGKAPLKGSAESKSSFGGGGGGGMPSKSGPSAFGKAPLKGAATAPGSKSFGKASSAPLFPNKGGIVAESDSSFVARDILLDAELGRGTPAISSDEPPPSSVPPAPKAASNRRPVFGLGGAFGKTTSRQLGFGSPKSAGPMPTKGSMPKGPQTTAQGFSSVSPPNTNMPKRKQQSQPPPQRGPVPAVPSSDGEIGMNQAPPQPNRRAQSAGSNVNPFAGEGARQGRAMRQPMADNFAPNSNQFAGRQSVRDQQPQQTANAPPPRQNFSQPPRQSADGFQQGPSDWKNQASPSPIGQFSNSVRDAQMSRGTRLGSLASSGQQQYQQPPGTDRSTATGWVDNERYPGGFTGPDGYQEVTVTDPRTGDRRTIRVPPPN